MYEKYRYTQAFLVYVKFITRIRFEISIYHCTNILPPFILPSIDRQQASANTLIVHFSIYSKR